MKESPKCLMPLGMSYQAKHSLLMLSIHYATYHKTADGKIYDIGQGEYRPSHNHSNGATCDQCRVINAWSAPVKRASIAQVEEYRIPNSDVAGPSLAGCTKEYNVT